MTSFRTIALVGILGVTFFSHCDTTPDVTDTDEDTERPAKIVFFGDQWTAGLGLNTQQSYPAYVRERAAEQGYNWRISNASITGETIVGASERLDWVLQQSIDVFVLASGANPPIPDALNRVALDRIVQRLRQLEDIQILLIPPTKAVLPVYQAVADQYQLRLLNALPERTANLRLLNPAGNRLNEQGVRTFVDQDLLPVLKDLLKERRPQ